MMLFRRFAEFLLILHRRFHKQVKSAVGFRAGKTIFCQRGIDQVPVSFIGFQIHGHVMLDAVLDHLLHQGRRVHASQNTVGDGRRLDQLLGILQLVGDHQITDPLAGNRKGFAVGIHHHRVMVIIGNKRHLDPAVCQLPVRLVGNQDDRSSEFLFLALQDRGQAADDLLAVHDARGIIWIVDDHRFCRRRDLLFKLRKLRHKGFRVRRNHHDLSVVISYIPVVLHKVRSKYDHLVARVQNTF